MSENDQLSESTNQLSARDEALPIVAEKNSAGDESKEEKESFFTRLWKAFVNFLRTLLRFVIIFGVLGAVIFYGVPLFTQIFVTPVQQNTQRINAMEIQISALLTKQSDLNSRLLVVEGAIESYSASLENLEAIQSSIENQLQANNDKVLIELKHETMLTRAFDMLARARLYLSQSNFGLAKEDVQNARDLLFELQTETSDETLSEVIARLDLALSNLPQFPVIASGDLEIAWQILISGEGSAIGTSTPTPAPFIENATPTPFDVPSVTPTP
jgi:hypothetical protein